ncbi:MAG: hypothetical protein AAB862_00580, partial [Patescibacteria group bacterium]
MCEIISRHGKDNEKENKKYSVVEKKCGVWGGGKRKRGDQKERIPRAAGKDGTELHWHQVFSHQYRVYDN